jgi:hypothetical protein
MSNIYQIPEKYLFRLHHIRPRFKNDVEEVLLYVAGGISEMGILPKKEFNQQLNETLSKFKKNGTATKKTINNWRTEISSLFGFIQKTDENNFVASLTSKRLVEKPYLDEFFNYFLYTFQYPGGHIKGHNVAKQIEEGIKFKPCKFILELLREGEFLKNKPFSITAEELTQCAYFDLRVTRDSKSANDVAKMIIEHRNNKTTYNYKFEQLKTSTGEYLSRGDVNRYAGDILDYMVLAGLLNHKGTGYYYYLNTDATEAINYHLNTNIWFNKYDNLFGKQKIENSDITQLEEEWFAYVNHFDNIDAFIPKLNILENESISKLIQEYYSRLKGGQQVPTKIIGDYGESLVLGHEYLRTKDKSNRQHLIQKIPTHLGVGYDIQSIEFEKGKRYIEVKTTRSRKAINNNRFKLTPNEWDTAETIGQNYFIYYLMVNAQEKRLFVIQNPVKQVKNGNLVIDKNLLVKFEKQSGEWEILKETQT